MGSPIDINGNLPRIPEEKLFGRFFKNVPECLCLMKANNSFSTGGAVLNAFDFDPNWLSSGIALYVDDRGPESGARTAWELYLSGEGYSSKERTQMIDGQVRRDPILDIDSCCRLVGKKLMITRSFYMSDRVTCGRMTF